MFHRRISGSKGKTKEKKFRGNVTELRGHVFTYGSTNFKDCFVKIVEAISKYVGWDNGKPMWRLVKNGNEATAKPKEQWIPMMMHPLIGK